MAGRHRRRSGTVLPVVGGVAAVVVVVAVAVPIALTRGGHGHPRAGGTASATGTPSPTVTSSSPAATMSPTPTTSASPRPSPTRSPSRSAPAPRPRPTVASLLIQVPGEASWVTVADPTRSLFRGFVLHGQTRSFSGPRLYVLFGNAGALRISIDAGPLHRAGVKGEVLRLTVQP